MLSAFVRIVAFDPVIFIVRQHGLVPLSYLRLVGLRNLTIMYHVFRTHSDKSWSSVVRNWLHAGRKNLLCIQNIRFVYGPTLLVLAVIVSALPLVITFVFRYMKQSNFNDSWLSFTKHLSRQ
jgi:hypothetical protein